MCAKCKVEKDAEFEVRKTRASIADQVFYHLIKYTDQDDDEDLDDLASGLMKKQDQSAGYPARKEDYDEKTKKLGEYLLLGYTMLENCCDGSL